MNHVKLSVQSVLLTLLLCSFWSGIASAKSLEFVNLPTVSPGPNASTPLVAILEFSTSLPTKARVEISDGTRTFEVPTPTSSARDHRITLLNLRAETLHEISLTVMKGNGNGTGHETLEVSLSFETDPLPEDFPSLTTNVYQPEQMEPGVTLLSLMKWNTLPFFGGMYLSVPDANAGILMMVDDAGEVVWYHRTNHMILDVRKRENGNIIYGEGNFDIVEIDMEGNVINHYFAAARNTNVPDGAIEVETDTFHHEVFEMPNKHILTLSTELRMLPEYPTSEFDAAAPPSDEPVPVVGDVVVEMNKHGKIVDSWNIMDMLDPYIIGYDSLTETHWQQAPYEEYVIYDQDTGMAIDGPKDWSHGNAVVYDEVDDAILVSLRHLDAVIKFDRQSGDLLWILGDHDGWTDPFAPYLLTPIGDLEWQYHQHAPMVTAAGDILIYDNGNYRAKPFMEYFDENGNPLPNPIPDSELYSRAVIYNVDDTTMTVSQEWEAVSPYFSKLISDADELPETGNILITNGAQMQMPFSDAFWYLFVNKRVYIEEIARGTGDTVFELFVGPADPWIPDFTENREDWASYRADRVPTVF